MYKVFFNLEFSKLAITHPVFWVFDILEGLFSTLHIGAFLKMQSWPLFFVVSIFEYYTWYHNDSRLYSCCFKTMYKMKDEIARNKKPSWILILKVVQSNNFDMFKKVQLM